MRTPDLHVTPRCFTCGWVGTTTPDLSKLINQLHSHCCDKAPDLEKSSRELAESITELRAVVEIVRREIGRDDDGTAGQPAYVRS